MNDFKSYNPNSEDNSKKTTQNDVRDVNSTVELAKVLSKAMNGENAKVR